jgi:uncharacterized protein YbjT (DUF2867 family)
MVAGRNHILINGGGTFAGNAIAAALLAEGASVQMIVRPGADALLGPLRDEVEWWTGDPWNPASLRGRARGAAVVIHTVGSMIAYPQQGLNHTYLNTLSLRNVVNMCVTDGAPRLLYVSAARAPWLPRHYIRAKRDSEAYIARMGLQAVVVRAPLLYERGWRRPFVFRLVSLTAAVTPFSGRSAPMPVDVFARGVARLALGKAQGRVIYFARDLWRLNNRNERRGLVLEPAPTPFIPEPPPGEDDTKPNHLVPRNDL